MEYIPLHVHSQYSILDSTLSTKEIVKKCKEFSISTCALTDFCNMYGVVDFFDTCLKNDIKPIIGCEMMIAPGNCREKKRVYGSPAGYPLIFLAKDATGYQNLCKLSSIAFLEGFYYYPRIDFELIKKHSKGLICLSGPFYSKIGSLISDDKIDEAKTEIDSLLEIFGEDLFLEVSLHQMSEETFATDGIAEESWLVQKIKSSTQKQEVIAKVLKEIGASKSIPLVATNDVRYADRSDFRAHEVLMNVSSGEPCEIWEKDAYGNPKNCIPNPKRQTTYSHELYFKSPKEMQNLFADIPEAIKNTQIVADRCDFNFDFSKRFYPVFEAPKLEGTEYTKDERLRAAESYLRQLCEEGIPKRYDEAALAKVAEKHPDKDPLEVVRERLEYELDVIISKGMCDYLLIVHDFIDWAKKSKIPVGPGRGSGAGAITLYLIGITDIEPLRFNLFFERFINPQRPSYPDIDVDICMERRSEVIEYTLRKYGRERVAQIITFGTMKAKMAIKDVGRVLSIPLSKVNTIAGLIPEDPKITINSALEIDADLRQMYEEDEDTRRILDLGRKVEGSIRNTGIHAAGLIICGESLTDHIPVCSAKDTEIYVTQYSMKPVEKVGMLKVDFLGLKTLTCIQKAVDAVKDRQGIDIDWVNLPLDDPKTYSLLNQGKTMGIFQLESTGMQELVKQLSVDRFEEIFAVGALYRPGPMEMIPSFIARKHGTEKIEYDHDLLKDILKETYGIFVYQEQVMQLAQLLAGYTLGEGDLLRKAMGKKDAEEMQRQKHKFLKGAVEKEISEEVALKIFEKVEKFASYGFNKSHATAYGYLSYVTAFLKANYPGEWLAASMTCDMTDLTKVAKHIREGQAMGICILPPHINESSQTFVATKEGIHFALCAIKGVGEGVVEAIVAQRDKEDNFVSLVDFLKRVDLTQVGKKVMENLIVSGSFDFTQWSRKQLTIFLLEHFDSFVREKKEKEKGIMDLFANPSGDEKQDTFISYDAPVCEEEDNKLERLSIEKALLGFYVTGHPLEEFEQIIERMGCVGFDKVEDMLDRAAFKAAFIVDTLQVRISQRTQKKFAILTISNGIERFELPVWPELFDSKATLLDDNAVLIGVLQVDRRDNNLRLGCKALADLSTFDEAAAKEIDDAYQAAERMFKMDSKGKRKVSKKPREPEVQKKVSMKVDINKISMSEILRLKELLVNHGGKDFFHLIFMDGEKKKGKVEVESSFGVNYSDELKKELATLASGVDLICE